MNKLNYRRKWAFVRKAPSPAWLAGEAAAATIAIFLLLFVFFDYRTMKEVMPDGESFRATRIDAALPEYRKALELRDPAAVFRADESSGSVLAQHFDRNRLRLKPSAFPQTPLPPPPEVSAFQTLTRPVVHSVASVKPLPERRRAAGPRPTGVIFDDTGRQVAELYSTRPVAPQNCSLIKVVCLEKYACPVLMESCGDPALDFLALSRLPGNPAGHYLVLWPGNSAEKGSVR